MIKIKQQSNIDNVAFDVFNQPRHFIMPKITVTLHNKDDDYPIDLVTDVRVSRNFSTNITDVLFVEFMMPAGTYFKTIYPKRDDLEITLLFNYDNKAIRKLRYKFILLTENPDVNTSHSNKLDESEQDESDLLTIKGECVDKLTLNLKNQYISGIYHDMNLKQFMSTLINYEVKIHGVESKIMVYEPDNKDVYRNILIKPFTKLIKVPYILQKEMFGVYNNGINIYFTKIRYGGEYKVYNSGPNKDKPEWLFGTGENYDIEIFPLHDVTRYDKETLRPKLLIVSPSVKEMSTNDSDFFYQDGVFKLVISDITFKDSDEGDQYNIGKTIALTDTESILDSSGYDITNDDVLYSDKDHNSLETLTDKPETFDTVIDTDLDHNAYTYRSVVNRTEVIPGIMKLGKINPDFIYPGMPFKYIFDKDGLIAETTGIVQAVEYYYDIANKATVVAIAGLFRRIKEK